MYFDLQLDVYNLNELAMERTMVFARVHSGCHNGSGYIGICSHYSVVIREAKLIDGTVILIRGRAINEQILKSTYETIKPVF